MKKILIATTIAIMSVGALAQQSQGANANANTSSNSVSAAQGGNQGQGQTQGIVDSGNGTATVSGVNSNSAGGAATVNGLSSASTGGASSVNGVSSASAGGTVSGVAATGTNQNSIGCLVNCAADPDASKNLADAQVRSAIINADAARDIARTTQVIRNTPSVSGPPLASSNDTCMGSTSGSANAPGIGLSFGSTWVDTNCKMLKNSRELWNMGMKGAAMALMCTDPDNKEALESTGFECPQTTKSRNGNPAVQRNAAASQEKFTAPIVKTRLGMADIGN